MRIALDQLEFIDPILREMANSLETVYGVEFTITSIYRIGDNGVHGQLPVRGLDLRCWNDSLGMMIEEDLNSVYLYDPNRHSKKVCIYHDTGRGAHLHLQVHANTRLR